MKWDYMRIANDPASKTQYHLRGVLTFRGFHGAHAHEAGCAKALLLPPNSKPSKTVDSYKATPHCYLTTHLGTEVNRYQLAERRILNILFGGSRRKYFLVFKRPV